jgi:hypothetical protein
MLDVRYFAVNAGSVMAEGAGSVRLSGLEAIMEWQSGLREHGTTVLISSIRDPDAEWAATRALAKDQVAAEERARAFCDAVGEAVLRDYGHEDGADQARSLLDLGEISVDNTVAMAAQLVAQMMEQA